MHHNRALAIFEVVVLLVLLVLVIGIILPMIGASRRTARAQQRNMQELGILGAFELYAQGNNGWYPGIKNDGSKVLDPTDEQLFPTDRDEKFDNRTFRLKPQHPNNMNGATASTRLALLLNNIYFSGEYLLSPAENKGSVWTTGQLTTYQFSYALLQIDAGISTTSQGRRETWSSASARGGGSTTPILCDKSIDQDPTMLNTTSLWVTTTTSALSNPNDWRGNVGWNDGHVSLETSAALSLTKFGKIENHSDNLFTSTDGSATTANAAMVYN